MIQPQTTQIARNLDYGFTLARVLLFLLIFSVAISPRINFSDTFKLDLRIQDLILIPIIIFLILSQKMIIDKPLRELMRPLLTPFIVGLLIVAVSSILSNTNVPSFVRIAFTGRVLELFILASCVAGLALRSGPQWVIVTTKAIYAGWFVNILWVSYQFITGVNTTFFTFSDKQNIESYGPQLIGEGSAFGAGQYFAFTAALAAANLWSKRPGTILHIAVLGLSFWATYIVQSRISMGSVLVIIAMLVMVGRKKYTISLFGIVASVALFLFAFFTIFPELSGRVSMENIRSGFSSRQVGIWDELWQAFLSSPFIGVGPGGLVLPLRSEAHNIYLRSLLDFGIIFGIIFILIFIHVLRKSFTHARSAPVGGNLKYISALTMFSTVSILFSGLVQDALTGVMSSHLEMISIGLFAAILSEVRSAPKNLNVFHNFNHSRRH